MLPFYLRLCDSLGQFKRLLKTHLFGVWDRGALWRLRSAVYKSSYLLAYLIKLSQSFIWPPTSVAFLALKTGGTGLETARPRGGCDQRGLKKWAGHGPPCPMSSATYAFVQVEARCYIARICRHLISVFACSYWNTALYLMRFIKWCISLCEFTMIMYTSLSCRDQMTHARSFAELIPVV